VVESAANRQMSRDEERAVRQIMESLNIDPDRARDKHTFWDTQPVPRLDQTDALLEPEKVRMGPIDEPKTPGDVRQEPYTLPTGFGWCEMDMKADKDAKEVYTLLNENYVEDDDNMFRFDYSINFLRWALMPPGYKQLWHVGVRTTEKAKLVGFITAIPATVATYGEKMSVVEINFLCVHKKLRSKRLAPVLIKEITRRVNLENIWQAAYTAGITLPRPIASCRYYHRSLNPRKLIDVGFSRLQPRMTMKRTVTLYKLDEQPKTPGLRPLEEKDCAEVCKLLQDYLKNFDFAAFLDEDEFKHWLLPRPGVINSYVVQDPASGKITDFMSFYMLPSTIIGNKQYPTLKAAYSYYNVRTSRPWVELMTDALILACIDDFDVFNALDIFENMEFLKELKFGVGDGQLQYYLYNWNCSATKPEKVGLVLL